MHVIAPHMRGQQIPTAVPADLFEHLKHDRAAVAVQFIRGVIHATAFRCGALWIGLQQSASKQIVMTVYGTRFITVKMRAVAGKSNEVPHGS